MFRESLRSEIDVLLKDIINCYTHFQNLLTNLFVIWNDKFACNEVEYLCVLC